MLFAGAHGDKPGFWLRELTALPIFPSASTLHAARLGLDQVAAVQRKLCLQLGAFKIGTPMDLIDRKIIDLLQRDATLSIAQIADRVGLSQTPCWKRTQKLEQSGIIIGRVALIAPEAIGLGLTVLVTIETGDHAQEWRTRFAETVSAMPEVMELYRMAGEVDYMLRVVVKDMAAYDAFYKKLTDALPLKNVTSRFAMERIKATSAYPIDTTTQTVKAGQ